MQRTWRQSCNYSFDCNFYWLIMPTKPNQSGWLNYKAHIWSFCIVFNHTLKLGVWSCSKDNLQTKRQGIGAAPIIQVQASTTSPCFSFHHVLFLNCSSLPWTSVHITEDSGWNKERGGQTSQIKRLLSKQTGKKFKRSIDKLSSDSPAPNSALSFWCVQGARITT